MKLFRTKKVAFEGLKLSIKLYRMDKSDNGYDTVILKEKEDIETFIAG